MRATPPSAWVATSARSSGSATASSWWSRRTRRLDRDCPSRRRVLARRRTGGGVSLQEIEQAGQDDACFVGVDLGDAPWVEEPAGFHVRHARPLEQDHEPGLARRLAVAEVELFADRHSLGGVLLDERQRRHLFGQALDLAD